MGANNDIMMMLGGEEGTVREESVGQRWLEHVSDLC